MDLFKASPQVKKSKISVQQEYKMTQPKKKLSKSAKEALKVLENSKLLANSKTQNHSNAPQNIKPEDLSGKTSAPNKRRPAKKRG
jgi:hypothetical protein